MFGSLCEVRKLKSCVIIWIAPKLMFTTKMRSAKPGTRCHGSTPPTSLFLPPLPSIAQSCMSVFASRIILDLIHQMSKDYETSIARTYLRLSSAQGSCPQWYIVDRDLDFRHIFAIPMQSIFTYGPACSLLLLLTTCCLISAVLPCCIGFHCVRSRKDTVLCSLCDFPHEKEQYV